MRTYVCVAVEVGQGDSEGWGGVEREGAVHMRRRRAGAGRGN